MAATSLTEPADLTVRRRWAVLAICALSMLVVGLDTTIVNVGLPAIGHARASRPGWLVVTACGLFLLVVARAARQPALSRPASARAVRSRV
ncbi:hypothetical protein [Micromonospora sp. AMSO31t]|uniref:hypothetical protein n=1 Tax=Micromonospora sp. AMSO31t TaxID=2650566 RepID=UPI00124B4BBA|nr:hypothetical protein [Micromonospora sp. AMSO31t]KAB1911147.1 hypothetical protein F8274_18165 [Micromonospora sp. AMSO31t]